MGFGVKIFRFKVIFGYLDGGLRTDLYRPRPRESMIRGVRIKIVSRTRDEYDSFFVLLLNPDSKIDPWSISPPPAALSHGIDRT